MAHVQMHRTDRVWKIASSHRVSYVKTMIFTEKEEQTPEASLPEAVPCPMHRLLSGKPAASKLLTWSEMS